MTAMIRSLLLLFAAALLLSSVAAAETPRPADEVFNLSVERGADGALLLDWTIAPGTYLYRDSLKAGLQDTPVSLKLPEGEEKNDPNFGLVEVYHDAVQAALSIQTDASALTVSYQGCAEQGICYPPVHKTVDLATLEVSGGDRLSSGVSGKASPWQTMPATASEAPSSVENGPDQASSYLNGNVFLMLSGFVGFGLLLSFTPCVFPMIPILSATLAGAGEKLSTGRGFALSLAYVVAMAAAYGLVGLVAGWSGANLQAALQTPWALGFSAVVFVVLALGMFGVFEFQLPPALATRLAGRGRSGSIAGAAVIGFGSALIVGPCVTPPLAAAMLYAISTGEAVKGGFALFALGLGMGLPLIAFGTFGARILPKSGPWLAAVRNAFGVVFVAVAIMLVARLLPPPAALALWGASAIALAVFAGAFDRLSDGSGWADRSAKASGLLAFVAGAILIIGAAAGESDPLRPLAFLSERSAATATAELAEIRVTTPAAFDRALESAAASGKPALVSFTADWCTICKSNEKVMAEPAVATRLQNLPVITVDVTRQNADAQNLMRRFAVVGPPTLVLVDADGRALEPSRITGPITTETMSRSLALAGI